AISLANGALDWSIPLGSMALVTNARGLSSAPAPLLRRANNTLYILTANGALLSIDLTARRLTWAFTHDTPAPNPRSLSPFGGSPDALQLPSAMEIVGSTLYFKERNGNTLFAV